MAEGVTGAIDEWIGTLRGPEAQVIKRVFHGMTFRAIAEQDTTTIERVRTRYRRAVSILRHPSRAQIIARYSGNEDVGIFDYSGFEEIFKVLRRVEQFASRDSDTAPLLCCPRHGWIETIPGQPPCPECFCSLPIAYGENGGRPRQYCSNACRQRAYRDRARQAASALRP
jgi:muconolactone delta-isomerase